MTYELILEISHGGDDFLMTEFTFDEVQTMEPGDFVRDSVPMSFNQHSSPVVLYMMMSMSYMPGLGLGRRQHSLASLSQFWTMTSLWLGICTSRGRFSMHGTATPREGQILTSSHSI